MLKDSQVDLCGRTDFTRTAPLLARDEAFSFACAGCGGCCRGREDIVLSGFDLWRISARLRLPPRTVAPGVLPGKHRAGQPPAGAAAGPAEGGARQLPLPHREPLRHPRCRAAGLRPLPAGAGDHEGRSGILLFAAHPVRRAGHCGKGGGLSGPVRCAHREATDVRWAQVCMELEDTVERLEALFEPVFARRMQEKLWQALYYRYDFAKEYRPQLEENLLWLDGELKKLEGMQMRHRTIEKSDR